MSLSFINGDKIAISIDHFLGTPIAHVDIYLQLGKEKFVKVIKKGAPYEIDRLRRYKDKEVSQIFIPKEQFPFHVQETLKIAKLISQTSNTPNQSKIFALTQTARHVFQEFFCFGLNEEAFEHTKNICESISSLDLSTNEMSFLVKELSRLDEEIIKHSIACSFITALLVHALQWNSGKTQKILVLSAFLHDIGFIQLPQKIFSKKKTDLSEKEWKTYKQHPELGAQIVQKLPNVPKEVIYIIMEHHEEYDGSGFPKGLKSSSIYPLSRCLNLANELSHLLLDRNSPLSSPSILKAIEYLRLKKGNHYPTLYWEALSRWSLI